RKGSQKGGVTRLLPAAASFAGNLPPSQSFSSSYAHQHHQGRNPSQGRQREEVAEAVVGGGGEERMMARAGEWEEVAYRRMGGSRGVREDLSEITRALARQLYVVADFLAPPPPSRPPPPSPCSSSPSSSLAATGPSAASSPPGAIVGVRSDLAEIGGGFKTGFVALSCLLRNSAEKEGGGDGGGRKVGADGSRAPRVVGVTEEVLKFVEFLSGRPEEWVQCPVPLDNLEFLGHLTQKLLAKVARAVQIVEEMDRALQELRNRIIERLENSRAEASSLATNDRGCEIEEVDSEVPAEASAHSETASSWANANDKENIDHWLEDVEFLTSHDLRKQLGSEDEVFLSDLENEDSLLGLKRLTSSSSLEVVHVSPPGSCSEWTPLRDRSGLPPRSSRPAQRRRQEYRADGESSDWVDAGDSDSTLG
ncbi:hypothetical protein Taro_014216, partial [Colocasia esculenta]|nr:hypothetical protein [Colocasia esculenta]